MALDNKGIDVRKIRKRVNLDRIVWQKLKERQSRQSKSFSELITNVLEKHLSKKQKVKTKLGPSTTIDITIDNDLWEKARKHALERDMSMSQLVRQLLREYSEALTKGGNS